MFILYILGAYTLICGILLFALLMGQNPTWRGTIVGRTNICLRNLPQNALYCCCLLRTGFNKQNAEHKAGEWQDYLTDKPNPLIQLFYSFLVGSALYFFYDVVAPQMKTRDVYIVTAICCGSVSCYMAAWLVDPGAVLTDEEIKKLESTNKNGKNNAILEYNKKQNERFAFDEWYYKSDVDNCRTCLVKKPARSKHCKICGRCFRRWDHHCPWINACVGENNLKWFHAFLMSHVVMSSFVSYWSGWVIYNYIETRQLWKARYARGVGAGSESLQPSTSIVLLYAVSNNSIAAGLCLFAAVIAILLFGFWFMNFQNVYRNETTNETHKRDDFNIAVKKIENLAKASEQEKKLEALLDDIDPDDDEEQLGKKKSCDKKIETPIITREQIAQGVKFYRGSLFRNIMEVLFVSSAAANPEAAGWKNTNKTEKPVSNNNNHNNSKKKK